MLCLSDRIGHDGAACAKGLVPSNGRITNRLVLDFGIELGAEQNDD